jgi:hypothetical protein
MDFLPLSAYSDVYDVPENRWRGRQDRPRLIVELRLPTEIAGFRIDREEKGAR